MLSVLLLLTYLYGITPFSSFPTTHILTCIPFLSQELLNARDSLEGQLHELTVQLGHVEEQRIGALRDMENMRVGRGTATPL